MFFSSFLLKNNKNSWLFYFDVEDVPGLWLSVQVLSVKHESKAQVYSSAVCLKKPGISFSLWGN